MGFRTYLWDRRRSWLLALGLLAVLLVVLLLFRLPVLAVGYGALLCGVIYLGAGIWDFVQWSRRHHRLQNLEQEVLSTLDNLPPPGSSLEEDYQRLLVSLFRAKAAQSAESSSRFQNMTDYYTLWAHQIKTPIAAMDLILQTQELPESGSLKQSLFQIQQYVEMVLCYLRLDSETTDFVIRACPLDPIIRTALREFAPSFIHKGLQLHYTPVSCSVLTDEKWLLFVLEQLLSNAVKYTPHGSVTACESPRPWSSRTPAWASLRRTCPGCLSGATPASWAGWTNAPPASACISAAAPSASWATPSPSSPPPAKAPPSPSTSSAGISPWSSQGKCVPDFTQLFPSVPLHFLSKGDTIPVYHAGQPAGMGKGFLYGKETGEIRLGGRSAGVPLELCGGRPGLCGVGAGAHPLA